ncbi:YqiA/YcfP family alpha/beta fold hydrolase [Janthinobacterium sp. PC23-8]|uniref:YqiA/YcfP family alpha/beta fold hydrolase n=1 Tax=Janthinobacterium sp. PC23-8 TaxID=2012679 RepID=UPI000B96CEA6|nr:YqiA/YcfP family alpha/beta fold hydrolase [Janthinobacterium sp. PC23-8]OYO30855.1 esterase [Janthinobacterium sp. PC23-8]
MILYLHGFRSSPLSMKSRLLAARMQALGRSQEWLCPQLPASPKLAIELALSLVKDVPARELIIIGSSLGGYYATWLAEQLGCRAVLLNPAIVPLLDLEQHVGVTTAFHSDEPFEFKRGHIDELRGFAVPAVSQPERYFLIAATGDEVLDYRHMVAHYAGARQTIINGSDHGISEFADYLAPVLQFCGIDTKAGQ